MLLRDLDTSDAIAHRVRLTASFSIAGLTTIVSIVHAYYLWQDTQISIIVSNVEVGFLSLFEVRICSGIRTALCLGYCLQLCCFVGRRTSPMGKIPSS
jgi:hypothetical protein